MCDNNSTTWSNHVQLLCLRYGFPPPLSLLQSSPPPSKEAWNSLVKSRVTIWHEQKLRKAASNNSKMKYLNVELSGLSGRHHPILQNICTTQEAKKLRLHLKFLTCDFLTNERLSIDRPTLNPACDLCLASIDSIEHVLVSCRATSDIRSRLYPELCNAVAQVLPDCNILLYHPPPSILAQFILDCSSLNLPNSIRVPTHNPGITSIYRVSRDWCYGISSERSRLLRLQSMTKSKDDM